jgi:hypothetical protein
MSATAASPPRLKDAPVTEPVKDELFQHPVVRPGQIVVWYPIGEQSAGIPAIVTRINGPSRSIALSCLRVGSPYLDAQEKESVFHRDDPRVREMPHLQKAGCWDLTQEDKDTRATIADLRARIAAIESKSKP